MFSIFTTTHNRPRIASSKKNNLERESREEDFSNHLNMQLSSPKWPDLSFGLLLNSLGKRMINMKEKSHAGE